MSGHKRRRTFIDKKVQGALAVRTLYHWGVFMLVSCSAAVTFQFLLNPFGTFAETVGRFWMHQGPFIVVAICLFPIFARDTVNMSHRFVGPTVRVRRALRDLRAGRKVTRVQFRPNDYWPEMANEVNELVEEVQRLRDLVGTKVTAPAHSNGEYAEPVGAR